MKKQFQWNGEPCQASFVNIKILPTEVTNLAWWKPFEGEVRRVIEIEQNGHKFLIDNEDGLGYSKITHGGGFMHGSRHFDGMNYEVVGYTPEPEIVTVFNPEAYASTAKRADDYWRIAKPDEFWQLQALKAMVK
jgi:hypothetical protein